MLVDLPDFFRHSPLSLGALFDIRNARPERLSQGVYRWHFNFANDLRGVGYLKSQWPFSDLNGDNDDDYVLSGPQDFGVCDDPKQITEKWPELLTSARRFMIGVTPIYRKDQPADGGWRWHKWGEYIGIKTPQHEYLYDEKEIDVVWVFNIVELEDF